MDMAADVVMEAGAQPWLLGRNVATTVLVSLMALHSQHRPILHLPFHVNAIKVRV
jgi:hypothetical protein